MSVIKNKRHVFKVLSFLLCISSFMFTDLHVLSNKDVVETASSVTENKAKATNLPTSDQQDGNPSRTDANEQRSESGVEEVSLKETANKIVEEEVKLDSEIPKHEESSDIKKDDKTENDVKTNSESSLLLTSQQGTSENNVLKVQGFNS